MKFLVFSDLHIHNYKKFDVEGSRLENCLKVLVDVFEYASINKISKILFAGDLYDQQKSIPAEVINATIETFQHCFIKYPGIQFIAISGNHDHSSKNTSEHSAITALTHLNNVFGDFMLIDDTYWSMGNGIRVYGTPYYSHSKDFELAKPGVDSSGIQLLLIHQTPKHSNEMIPYDCDAEDFEDFDFVFCGHIHKHERVTDNFVIVGSPLHRDLGDEGQDKGFLVFDTDVMDYERVILNYPKFQRVTSDNFCQASNDYLIEVQEQIHVKESDIQLSDSYNDMIVKFVESQGVSQDHLEIGQYLMS